MKQGPSQERINQNLQEGRFSKDGFLGEDVRPYEQIIRDDAMTLEALGLSAQDLGDRLFALTQKGLDGLGEWVWAEGFDIKVDEYMGKIPCPFRDFRAPKRLTTLKDANGRQLLYTDLGTHLIQEHGFFQGRGSDYRLEPAQTAAFLGLAAEDKP